MPTSTSLADSGHDDVTVLGTEAVADDGIRQVSAEGPPGPVEPKGISAFPLPWRHPLRSLWWCIRTLFGLASLAVLLAVIAAIPLVNFLALGYLLEVQGRVGRSGRLRDAFPLLTDAPRLGSIALGVWFCLLPLRLLGSWAADASLIDPGSAADRGLHLTLNIVLVLMTLHLVLALARGGSLACFLRPLKNFFWLKQRLREGGYLSTAGEHVRDFIRRLRLRYHFFLGLRGFAVAFAWLVIPTAFYAATRRPEGPSMLLTIVGGVLLTVTLSWVPFLQARFATENRLSAGFQLREIRTLFRHAPLAWTLATIVLYVLALPLYLFKAFLLPPDAMWPITLIFIVSMYPTRVITGWAYHRAVLRREQGKTSHWSIRWLCTGLLMPLLGVFVFILFFTQFLGEQGKLVLFHHHSLLLPAPFQGAILR